MDEYPRHLVAWAFWVQTNMSFGNKLFGGFAHDNTAIAKGSTTNKIDRFSNQYCQRLRNTTIFNRDAINVIKLKDSPTTFFYLDPPYVGSDMGHYQGYTQQDFDNLIDTLSQIQGKFILSSYPNEALDSARNLFGWKPLDLDKQLSMRNDKTVNKRKTECITYNFEQNQLKLF